MSVPAAQLGLTLAPPRPAAPARSAVPGEEAFARIKAEVSREIASRRGEAQAINGDPLAGRVRESLGLEALSLATVKRRCQEAISELVTEGEQRIASTNAGYFTPETADEIEAGRMDLGHRLASLAKRYRAYDRNTGDEFLRLLGQVGINLGDPTP